MEQIHEHVVVTTSQCVLTAVDRAVAASSPSPASPSASRTTALQFTVVNTGFDAVTFSADFRASSNIQLQFPQQSAQALQPTQSTSGGGDNDGTLQDGGDSLLLFDCHVAPLERKTLVHVLKVIGKRAFVRVQFILERASSPTVQEIEQAQRINEQALDQAIKRAQDRYFANNNSLPVHRLDNAPECVMKRCCADINRFFRAHERGDGGDSDARFVDTSFPPNLSSLIGRKDANKVKMDDTSAALYSLSSWRHLHDIMDTSWTFRSKNNKQQLLPQSPAQSRGSTMGLPALTEFKSPLSGQDALLGALAFLSLDKEKWLKQLFQEQVPPLDTDAMQALGALSVRICDRGMQWKQVVVDLFQPAFPIGSSGLMSVNALASGEVYGMIVQKAYAKLKGSYAVIGSIPSITILRELTGLPCEQGNDHSSSLHAATQQKTLQRLICRRHRHCRSKKHADSSSRQPFVVSFGRIGDHHCGFPVLTGDDQEGITLQDIDNNVRKALSSSLEFGDPGNGDAGVPGDERLAVQCTWEDFFQLEPHVWILFANHCEARRKRIKFVDTNAEDGDTRTRPATCLQFAFSVAEMTSLVISTQLQGENIESRHQLTVDVVNHDYSLTRIPAEATNELAGSELQLVLALGAGEYILTVNIETRQVPPTAKVSQQSNLLTSQDAERNLQLLFDCVDQDMDGMISLQELQAFLEMHEDSHEPSHGGEHGGPPSLEARFMDHFGSSNGNLSSSDLGKELLVDDLRDVYHHLAAFDGEDKLSEPARDKHTQRYQELIWSDLCILLLSYQAKTSTNNHHQGQRDIRQFISSIRADEIEELRCCVHSDAPLVNFVQLPTPFSPRDRSSLYTL